MNIEDAQAYGRELARLNIPSMILGEKSAAEIDDGIAAHLQTIRSRLRTNSDMSIEGMSEAIDNLVKAVHSSFMAETGRMIDAWHVKGGNA